MHGVFVILSFAASALAVAVRLIMLDHIIAAMFVTLAGCSLLLLTGRRSSMREMEQLGNSAVFFFAGDCLSRGENYLAVLYACIGVFCVFYANRSV